MKFLKSKDTKPTKEINIPELEIHGGWRKLFDRITHVRRIYWVIAITILLVIASILIPFPIWMRFWIKIQANPTIFVMLIIFSLVAVSLVWSVGQKIDVWVFRLFNMRGRRAPWLDWLMLTFTQLGNFIFALAVALILFFLGYKMVAYQLILGVLTLGLVIETMKIFIRRNRPFHKLENIRIVGSRASGRSFPSGHTGQIFLMATLLLHYFDGIIYVTLSMYGIASLVGITRIYVGMHYPRDVLGGAILGTAWGLFGVIVNSYIS